MRVEITSGGLCDFGFRADVFARRDDEECQVIALRIFLGATGRKNVVAQAKLVAHALALKMERVSRRSGARLKERDRISLALRFEKLPDGGNFHEVGGFALHLLHVVE